MDSSKSTQHCHLTAAMIRNNVDSIHGLIKHCLRSSTDKIWPSPHALGFAKWQVERLPREQYVNTSDVTCSAMKVEQRARESWIQIRYRSRDQNFEILSWTVVPTLANFHLGPFMHDHVLELKWHWVWNVTEMDINIFWEMLSSHDWINHIVLGR